MVGPIIIVIMIITPDPAFEACVAPTSTSEDDG